MIVFHPSARIRSLNGILEKHCRKVDQNGLRNQNAHPSNRSLCQVANVLQQNKVLTCPTDLFNGHIGAVDGWFPGMILHYLFIGEFAIFRKYVPFKMIP